jgi:hypothetical protein
MDKLFMEKCGTLGIKPTKRLLCVSIDRQTLQFFVNGLLAKAYVISTSRRPPSNLKGSLGTPRGLHEIAERIGAGQPVGMVFKGRCPVGRHFSEYNGTEQTENLITSRILWLRGLEPGFNASGEVDSYDRHIYIHGTNREDRIGTTQSAGCVLMHNLEIIELFEQVRPGDQVWIR